MIRGRQVIGPAEIKDRAPMLVKVDYLKLSDAATKFEGLADRIDAQRNRAEIGTPVSLPGLGASYLGAKSLWMRDQLPTLQGLATIAMLLDTDGSGTSTFTVGNDQNDILDKLGDIGSQFFDAEFFNIFGAHDGFPLVPLGIASGKMARMARIFQGVTVPPIFQTGMVGKNLLPLAAKAPGALGVFATWFLSPAGRSVTTKHPDEAPARAAAAVDKLAGPSRRRRTRSRHHDNYRPRRGGLGGPVRTYRRSTARRGQWPAQPPTGER